MSDRILKVNAYTTLDLLDAQAEGHDFEESALAVLNVTSDRKNPDAVELQLELDNTDLDHLPTHADEITLTPDEARTVAAALEDHADDVEAAADD
jgi:cellobiose phosphorylase